MASTTVISSSFRSSQSITISSELSERVLMTHSYTREVDLTPLVKVIDGILQNAVSRGSYVASTDMISSLESYEGMRQVLEDIRSISCEMSCNQTSVEATTMAVLRKLGSYSWNSKMVLAIAAFAVSIGELLMLVNHRTTDPIAKSVDLIKGQALRIEISVINSLFKAMKEVVQTNMAFLAPPISTIPTYSVFMKEFVQYFVSATYNILRIIVQIASIISKREDNIEFTIKRLTNEVYSINLFLEEIRLYIVKKVTEEVKVPPSPVPYIPVPPSPVAYIPVQPSPVPPTPVIGNGTITSYVAAWEIVPTISYWELIQKIKYSLKIQVPDKLRKKHVLFLISDFDISVEEIKILNHLYLKSNQRYEIVWLPMVNVATYNRIKFSELEALMKWSSVEPSKMGTEMMEYIKKEWHFVKNPIAVALNPEGRVICPNALPLLWTWGNAAFPFEVPREKELWSSYDQGYAWRLDLLIGEQIEQDIQSWIQNRAFVCLFGGENISWIQDFTDKVKIATSAFGVPFKLVYVGANKGKGFLKNQFGFGLDIHVIESESRWHFWTRLESILYAKINQGKNDIVMQEASRILGYADKGEAWATFAMGNTAMVTVGREMAINIMAKYNEWRQETTYMGGTGFLEAIRKYYSIIFKGDHGGGCINVHLPALLGEVPGMVRCPECSKEMKLFYTYRCCKE